MLESLKVTKINVSISKEILEKLDEAAREVNLSRSALLSQAVKHFLEDREEEKNREQRHHASEQIIRIAEEVGSWDGTAEILKWRDRH